MSTRLSLLAFSRDLRSRLDALSSEDLIDVLMTFAERLPATSRQAFLDIFPGPAEQATTQSARSDTSLLDEIASFAQQVEAGWYDIADEERNDSYGGWYDEDATPSWVPDADRLFAAVGEVFLSDRLNLACQAYTHLLDLFGAAGDFGTAPLETWQLEGTDVTEALARYLRSVYEISAPADRAAALSTAYAGLPWSPAPLLLGDVVAAGRTDLPDLAGFLPTWIDALLADSDQPGADLRTRLLTEAAILHGGTDSLAAVARAPGPHQIAVYLTWIDALATDRQLDAAADAAREALDLTVDAARIAEITDRLADIDTRRGRASDAAAARLHAWRARPTRRRLLALAYTATAAGTLAEVLGAEAQAIRDTGRTDRLGCELLLLAGDVDHAAEILIQAPTLGWSRADHPGPVVLPSLWIATMGTSPPPADHSHLGRAFAAIDQDRDSRDAFSATFSPGDSNDDATDDTTARHDPDETSTPVLTALLARALLTQHSGPPDRKRWLAVAGTVTENRVQAVVTGKHRRAYASAAALVMAHAETLATTQDVGTSRRYVTRIRDSYPRHVAFRRELDAALQSSALV